jgi:rhodanese-related sulfurtransferase
MPIREITVEELSNALLGARPPLLLDVRSEGEHDLARIEPCRLVPLPELPERVAELAGHEGEAIVVYCHHGVRSRSGAAILEAAGFRDVTSLRGGIEAWSLRIDPRVPRY